jgi:hydroxymethylpyrimidine pyrophosphatase-like HAD family hydrolase
VVALLPVAAIAVEGAAPAVAAPAPVAQQHTAQSKLNANKSTTEMPYGYTLFSGQFGTDKGTGVNNDYKIQPGDDVTVSLWGITEGGETVDTKVDAWVKPLESVLGCRFFSSTAAVEGDKLTGVSHVLDKGDAIREIRKSFDRMIAVGDGMGDVPMFEKSDVRIAFGATHAPIQSLIQFADYITYSEESLCTLLSTQ